MVLRYNTFTVVWALIILGLTLLTGETHSNMSISMLDKIVHSFMFGTLSFLMIVGFKKQSEYTYLHFHAVAVAIAITVLYGTLIECLQLAVPGRCFEWLDVLANSVGAILGYVMFLVIYKL